MIRSQSDRRYGSFQQHFKVIIAIKSMGMRDLILFHGAPRLAMEFVPPRAL